MENAAENGPAAALVLGAKVLPGGQPSAALKRRALQAARLYRQGRVAKVIASGGPPGARPTEAEVIRTLCLTAGVADEDIITEDHAASTADNIRNALPLLARHGIGQVWIVTDRYHARRAAMTARAYGLDAKLFCPPPIGTGRMRLLRYYLRELPALVLYALRHRPGR